MFIKLGNLIEHCNSNNIIINPCTGNCISIIVLHSYNSTNFQKITSNLLMLITVAAFSKHVFKSFHFAFLMDVVKLCLLVISQNSNFG